MIEWLITVDLVFIVIALGGIKSELEELNKNIKIK